MSASKLYNPPQYPGDPWKEVEGLCNAKRTDKTGLCRKKPEPGRKRCKHHGGCSTGPRTPEGKARVSQNRLRHGLYARLLNESMTPDEREVYDSMESSTDLAPELKVARLRLARIMKVRAMFRDPDISVEKRYEILGRLFPGRTKEGDIDLPDLDDLELAASAEVRRLALAQHHMHPGLKATGEFSVHIKIAKETKQAVLEDEDLESLADDDSGDDDDTPPQQQESESRRVSHADKLNLDD